MRLEVIGNPTIARKPTDAEQCVVVRYDPRKKLTKVTCDLDIVTLGLAVNILLDQYENVLSTLDAEVASKIRKTIARVVFRLEKEQST